MSCRKGIRPYCTNVQLMEFQIRCFYQGLCSENRMVADQLSSGCLILQSYETAARIYDGVDKTDKETKKDQLATLLIQLDGLTTKVKDLDIMSPSPKIRKSTFPLTNAEE